MQTIVTQKFFAIILYSAIDQSRKSLDADIVKLVLIDQHQKIHMMLALTVEL